MKSQVLTLLLLTIGAQLFQSTHQYRLRKRELTEYHLTSFIVNTCSADKIDVLIQNLCDQTLQSALMGNFPFLIFYCQKIGSGNRYCDNINRQTSAGQHIGAKRFGSRRFTREIDEDNKGQVTNTDLDLEQKLIIQMCLTRTEKSPVGMHRFCNRTLKEIEQERYPQIKRLCQSLPGLTYCRQLLSFSLAEDSSSSLSSATSSIPTHSYLSSVPLQQSSDVETLVDQRTMNSNS